MKEKNFNLEFEKSLKLLAKFSFIVFIGLVISKLFTYFFRIIVARYFGPEVYGLFSLAFMIASWFIIFSTLGLSDGILKYIPFYRGKKEFEKIRYIFQFTLMILAITSLLAGMLLFFFSDFIAISIFEDEGLSFFLKVFSLLIPFSALSYLLLYALKAYEKIKSYSFIANIFQNVAKVLILIIMIFLGFKIKSVAYSFLFGVFAMLVVSYLVCKHQIPQIFIKSKIKKQDKEDVKKELFKYSLPLLFSAVATTIFFMIDSLSIGYFKTAAEVGFYNSVTPIALFLGFSPELFMQFFFPLINRFYATKKIDLVRELSKQVVKWIFLINLPISALIILFPGAFINLLFGSGYLVAETALVILTIASLISSIFVVSNTLIIMTGRSIVILIDTIVCSILNIALNVVLIPMPKILFLDNELGIVGAAIATLISVTLFNLLFLFQSKRFLSIIPLRRKMLSISLAVIIPMLIMVYVKSLLIINIFSIMLLSLLFFILYLISVILVKGFDKNDLFILKNIKRKILSQKTPIDFS